MDWSELPSDLRELFLPHSRVRLTPPPPHAVRQFLHSAVADALAARHAAARPRAAAQSLPALPRAPPARERPKSKEEMEALRRKELDVLREVRAAVCASSR